METSLREAKAALRQRVRQELRGISDEQREADSARARALLETQSTWKQAETILFYAPLADELNLWPLLAGALREGKRVALPQFEVSTRTYSACQVQDPGTDLVRGQFGISEPAEGCAKVSLNRLDFVLVPGIAFDPRGRRLGRGRGFYDQMLAVVRGRICGVAFDNQIVSAVPVEAHDAYVNCILTPSRWLECQRAVLE